MTKPDDLDGEKNPEFPQNGGIPKFRLLKALEDCGDDASAQQALTEMGHKLSQAVDDLKTWHECPSHSELKRELATTGRFAEWCTSPHLQENLTTIWEQLQYRAEAAPIADKLLEQKHGSVFPFLEEGMEIKLKCSKELLQELAKSWEPHDATRLRSIMINGAGESQLQLETFDRIAQGRHWIEFGFHIAHHDVPRRKANASAAGILDSWDYGDLDRCTEARLQQFPRLKTLARLLKVDGASSKYRFLAELVDEPFSTLLLRDGGGEFLDWLVECGFHKVYLYFNTNVQMLSDIKERGRRLLDLLAKYSKKDLTFLLAVNEDRLDPNARELIQVLLHESPAKNVKMVLLYNASRGQGLESAFYRLPMKDPKIGKMTGYAGGFTPETVVQKLQDMRWIIPEGRHFFIQGFRGFRTADNKFCVERCLEFVNRLSESEFNPAAGKEVFPQHDGSLALGSRKRRLLWPDTLYRVTKICKSQFAVEAEGEKQTETIYIAGSIATEWFELAQNGGGLQPPLTGEDPTRIWKGKLFKSVCAANLRDYLQPPCRSSLKIVSTPANGDGPPYRGKTPLGYLKELLRSEEWTRARAIPNRDCKYAAEILQDWRKGLITSVDDGVGGRGHVSVASAGFASRAERQPIFRERYHDCLDNRGIAIVSIPGRDAQMYNTVIRICLEDGMHFAVARVLSDRDVWFYAWLRSVTEAMLSGCVPIVLTLGNHEIGWAQSAEVMALECSAQLAVT